MKTTREKGRCPVCKKTVPQAPGERVASHFTKARRSRGNGNCPGVGRAAE